MPRLHSFTVLTLLLLLVTIWTFCDPGNLSQPFIQLTSAEQDVLLARDAQIAALCNGIRDSAGQPPEFNFRTGSERWSRPDPKESKSYLIVNATIWMDDGATRGDILIERGIIKEIGNMTERFTAANAMNVIIVDADGSFATPGLVLLHSHAGLQPSPLLQGSADLNSKKGPIVPWLRALDAFHVHDESLKRYISEGITTVQVSPGDFNAIGGQSYVMKLRAMSQRTPSSMLVEPLDESNDVSPKRPPKHPWQYLTQVCGENLKIYGNTRMDTAWSIRKAYHHARQLAHAQDRFCRGMSSDEEFPSDFDLEILTDVLRGRVKVSSVCHEVADVDFLTRLSKEFKIPLAYIHSSEAWLAPHLVNNSFGEPPVVALMANKYRTNSEMFRGSEFAPRVLIDSGVQVAMTTDSSSPLIDEARLAYYFGLPLNATIASITSTPAKALGLDYRLGYLRPGFDGDIVLWSHHPLSLQAVPSHVWVDGDMVFHRPLGSKGHYAKRPSDKTKIPVVPNWDNERIISLARNGLPPLRGRRISGRVVLLNVKQMWVRRDGRVSHDPRLKDVSGTVVIEDGKIICVGQCYTAGRDAEEIDLKGGSISPGLMSVGSTIGLEELATEPSTGDGRLYTPFLRDVPKILDDVGGIVRAVDALQFQTRNALYAHRSGVTLATTAPGSVLQDNIIAGLSTTFRTGGRNALEHGAIIQDITALHVTVGRPHPSHGGEVSISTQIAALRRLLSGWEEVESETMSWFRKARKGTIPLVIHVDSADIMTALLRLKLEIEELYGSSMRLVFQSAKEAHLIAKDIGNLGVGVILESPRKMPQTWDQRRGLSRSPTNDKADLEILLENRVVVGVGQSEAWEASNLRFDIGWMNITGSLSVSEAYNLLSLNLERLMGIRSMEEEDIDLVLTSGGNIFEQSAKVIGIVSMGSVTLL